MTEKKNRVHVPFKSFLRVTVVERETFDTITKASIELGMTEASFKQRCTKERKDYPALFESVPKYTSKSGPRRPSQDEAQAILDELLQGGE